MNNKKKIILIRIIATIVLLFLLFNAYRAFDINMIPVGIAFIFMVILLLLILIKPKLLIEE